jgi:formate-dependent nitrite reductase cytochrome c552 subunit
VANFFPKWVNVLTKKLAVSLLILVLLLVCGVWYYFTPKYTRVGYEPVQPISFNHSLHVEQLGLDCRYCHDDVEKSPFANVPTTQTCMNCHNQVKKDSAKLAPLRESWETGKPVEWVQVHELPDYVFFNHAVHVNRGVSCVSCHGKVNEMEVVRDEKPLSMAWCLDCHREPEKHLRPLDEVTNLDWVPPEGTTQEEIGTRLKKEWDVNPPTNCAGCHR